MRAKSFASRGTMTAPINLWTDGACRGNPGPGGWGAVLRAGSRERHLWGGAPATTNNRMELMGALEALRALKRPSAVTLHTDSVYVLKGMTEWVSGWQRRGWRTATKKPVLNVELWQALLEAAKPHDIAWVWVKGHSGDPGNELADHLANRGLEAFALQGKTGHADEVLSP